MHGVSRWILVLASVTAVGCSSLKPVQLGPEPKRLSSSSWIALRNGERLELRDGRVTPDSVIGIYARLRRAIPRDSVVSVQQQEGPSPVPFVLLGALVVAVAVAVMTTSLGLTPD